ncbi:FAD-linked oxidase C-terminal domain-containing protein [Sorangium sp. So ce1036]|uniref:FAD-binding and (Fe-S)-binding domain-containing protein n=1 Tax=Sorangium sp. So ce1036 TaxID=3133328 RepID=UPI003F0BA9BB
MVMLVPLRRGRDDRRQAPVAAHDIADLEAELRAAISGEVRFDSESRAVYSTDGSNYRQVPLGVVLPRSAGDVVAAVAACRRHGAPVLPRGAGTSLAGQTCNVAVVLDFSKYMGRVLDIDPARRLCRVQPGALLDDLRGQAQRHGLTFAPDPSTHRWCTLGGMIGNNSCGVHSIMNGSSGGRTADYVEELTVLTYEGHVLRVGPTPDHELDRILGEGGPRGRLYADLRALRDRYARLIRARFPDLPRRVSGYNLDDLLPEKGFHVGRALAGSEGTCVVVLEALLRLIPSPRERVLLVLGYPDVYSAGEHLVEVRGAGPSGLEGIDEQLVDFLGRKGLQREATGLLPEGRGWLMAEFRGETRAEARDRARALMSRLERARRPPAMRLCEEEGEQEQLWTVRESGLAATAHVPGMREAWPGWEDSAVPPERLAEYLPRLRGLLDRFGYKGSLYGHFGQGCVHTRIDFDLKTRPGIDRYLEFVNHAADLVLSLGGSLSGEHGDGQARAALLTKMYGEELVAAFREFKAIWDPRWKMNPGKVVDPYGIDENLRLGTGYDPPSLETHFRYPNDHGSFAEATLRCVGVGKCRKLDGGTMCPSYMVTREEIHTTRGRARLLFEMLQGEETPLGWDNPDVRDALDLCLACKGCKGECPVHVDMATYKAEFLAHYYEHHRRPMAAYSMGLIRTWARLASLAPGLVNAVFRVPWLGAALKRLGGIAPQRSMPTFARRTFKRWFFARPAPAGARERPPVILWPDTFNDHFHPEVAVAAVEVLEDAGYRVIVPRRSLCCGRPLYDHGMLDRAKSALREILDALRPVARAGIPVVGLEPSCVAVFRDELGELFPHDETARRLREQTYLLSELLDEIGYAPPRLDGERAVLHGHCHQKAVLRSDADAKLLRRAGVECEVLDAGCCGMAGSFGYEARHYEISQAVGERVLLPAVRRAGAGTLVVTSGFSCRGQIEEGTGRRPLHVAEVLHLALRRSRRAGHGAMAPARAPRPRALPAAAVLLSAALALGISWRRGWLRR